MLKEFFNNHSGFYFLFYHNQENIYSIVRKLYEIIVLKIYIRNPRITY